MNYVETLFRAYFAAVRTQRPGEPHNPKRETFNQAAMARTFDVPASQVSFWKRGKVKIPVHVVADMAREIGGPVLPWILATQIQYAKTMDDITTWQMLLADAGGLPKLGGDEDKPLTRHLVDAMGGWDTVAQALTHEAMVAVGDPDGTRDARQAKALARAKEIAKRPADGETYDDLRARYPAIEACRDVESALALAVRPADDGELAEIRAMADA